MKRTMKKITVCLAYYENASMLQRQYEVFRTFNKDLKSNVSLIVVDDGSPDSPAVPPSTPLGIDFELYRVIEDIPWNQDACRNIAAYHADPTSWLILTDIDHLVPHETLEAALTKDLDRECAYQFVRVSEPDMSKYKSHPNSWLMTQKLYWQTGGYDERFAKSFGRVWGIYGTDGRFRKQVSEIALIHVFKMPIVRVPREVTSDASTTRYERRSDNMEAKRIEVRELIKNSGSREPAVLTCPYTRVA